MAATINGFLEEADSAAPAIGGDGRATLTFGELTALAADTRARLTELGIGRGDRVAIVLPNGPEMAAAFVAIATAAITCPLNPAYREEEFGFYLGDLSAMALVVAADYDGPALAVAERTGVAVLRLVVPDGAPAGTFRLEGTPVAPAPAKPGPAEPDDVSLILHTSGTTSRPKIVPLLQKNLVASARHIGAALDLSPGDRCLNVMPLFHIHGLIAAVLSSLAAGASVWCSPGFDGLRFFGWLKDVNPTWYTAVPTMHQVILSRAARNADAIAAANLRFIRSSSASLPPQVMAALEETFGAPVIESYGMTEATHQMTSNPLPPAARKAGSVGLAAGPAVRLADQADNRLVPEPSGEALGEVVISGPNVTPGYEANPDANAKSFFEAEGQRWFRTGDQGRFDDGGYLVITGRIKEIINRGGEKVSPLEVDAVIMDHPAVAQCVTFAVPHTKYGEDVAAAIVLKPDMEADEKEIRSFVSGRLADFKTPRKVVFLEEIPKGATGKLQRIGLAEKLGLAS